MGGVGLGVGLEGRTRIELGVERGGVGLGVRWGGSNWGLDWRVGLGSDWRSDWGGSDWGSDWGGRTGEVGLGSDEVAGKISQVSL